MVKMLTYNTPLEKVMLLTHPCRCHACENSCKFGSGALADEDIEKIAKFLEISVEELKNNYLEEIQKFNTKRYRPKLLGKPYGKCIFYDNGCKIHPVKPRECKIAMSCKEYGEELIIWFNLKHFFNPKDPESIRQYKIYLETGGKTLPGAELHNFVDEETLKKIENYEDLKDNTDWEEKLGLKSSKNRI